MIRHSSIIKREIDELQDTIKRLERQDSAIKRRINGIQHEIHEVEISTESLIKMERDNKSQEYIRSKRAPHLEKIKQIEQNIEQVETIRKDALGKMNIDEITATLMGKSPLNIEVKKKLEETKKGIGEEIGEQFLQGYLANSSSEIVDRTSIMKSINRVQVLSKQMEREKKSLSSKSQNTLKAIVKEGTATASYVYQPTNRITALMTVLMTLALSPIMVITDSIQTYTNLEKMKKTRELIGQIKIINDNENSLIEAINETAQEVKKSKEEKINKSSDEKIEALKKMLEDRQTKLKDATEKAKEEFTFDENLIRNEIAQKKSRLENQLEEEQDGENKLNEEIQEKKQRVEELKGEFESAQKKELGKYLDPNNEDKGVNFPDKIIFSTDPFVVYHTPVNKSQVIFYDDVNLMEEYINLFTYQIRNQVNAGLLEFIIIDQTRMCRAFGKIYKHLDKNFTPIRLVIKDEDIMDQVDNFFSAFYRNFNTLMLEKNMNVTEYNEYMLKNRSIPTKYKVIIYVDPPNNKINSLSQILRGGADLGIYLLYFLSSKAEIKDYLEAIQSTQTSVKLTEKGLVTYKAEVST